MYAIVEVAGRQYKVKENATVKVPLLKSDAGASVEFDKVLLVSGDEVKVGSPTVEGCKVTATVQEHGRDKKVTNFKKKRRKGYKRKIGHRQDFTAIKIDSITI
ncbi:MAG: 50S ribosomal protein L21 [Calditrichaeota bacterium]|nr:MAG: 50S ribosomal protein L21 [Calditrichota bacterium]